MADPRFFTRAGPFSLSRLAEIAGAHLSDGADGARLFSDVAALDSAEAADVGFLDNRRYVDAFTKSQAGACLVHPDLAGRAPSGMALLLTEDPYRGYALVAQAFYPTPAPDGGIAPTAFVAPDAKIGPGCRIEPGAAILARAEVGARCRISANAVIGEGVVVGNDGYIGPTASLTHCLVGDRVVIHAGARIGQDGFGFAMNPRGHVKVPQLGRVRIGNDVEIGANATIDRGAGPDTVVGDFCKIDNLVQIAHNVQLGRGCVVVAQVGISGSTKLGDFVAAGGQAGVTGHLTIGTGARLGAQSGVMRDVAPGETVMGSPAMPAKEYWRQMAALGKLAKGKGKKGETP